MQPVLKFNVRNQNISRVDMFLPVRYSRNYLYAEFDFKTCDWNEKTKTAIFSGTGLEPIPVILGETDTCLVPWEVLECTEFTVTVHAGDLITVDSAKVKLYESGYRPGGVPEPTPDVYQQLINRLTDQVDGLKYEDNILSLIAGKKSIASVTITGGSITPEQISEAVKGYLASNPIEETDPTVPAWAKEEAPDKSLTQEGKAADAKEVGDRLGELSATKVDLPKDADGNLIAPTEGQTLLFKSDGTTYYGTPSTGGDSGGGTEIVDTPVSVMFITGKFTGANGAFTPDGGTQTRISHEELIDGTTKNIKFVFSIPSDTSVTNPTLDYRIFLFDANENYVSNWNLDGTTDTTDTWRTTVMDGSEYVIPKGHKVRFVFGKDGDFSNAAMLTWANTDFKVYRTEEVSATTVEEPSVMMLSFNRAYIDTGEYTSNLEPKWDGMFSIHRGYSTAPNNTLQAIWEAKKHGYNCCELDVRQTSDGQIVLNHDATVTGKIDGVEVTYTIADTDLATLKNVCIGNTAFPEAKVCSLEDAMKLCRRIGMRPELDFKVNNTQIYNDCLALARKYGLQDDTLFCCYEIAYAVQIKTEYKKANVRVEGVLLDSDTSLDEYINEGGNIYAFYSASNCGKTDGSNMGANIDNETRIPIHKAKGYKMYVWNVTPFLLPDVMQWEPDILQPQSSKDNTDWYTAIRELNSFDGLVW